MGANLNGAEGALGPTEEVFTEVVRIERPRGAEHSRVEAPDSLWRWCVGHGTWWTAKVVSESKEMAEGKLEFAYVMMALL